MRYHIISALLESERGEGITLKWSESEKDWFILKFTTNKSILKTLPHSVSVYNKEKPKEGQFKT